MDKPSTSELIGTLPGNEDSYVEKRVLTPDTIQQLLRRQALFSLLACLFLTIGLIPSVAWLVMAFQRSNFLPVLLLACAFVTFFAAGFMIFLINCIAALVMSCQKLTVVKAIRIKPVGEKEKYEPYGGYSESGYIMHFHGYKRRHAGGGLYAPLCAGFEKWLSAGSVWKLTDVGDRFYIVPDKLNRVVFYFPCDLFEYTGALTSSKYER